MLPRTDSHGNSAGSWNRTARSGPGPVIGRPSSNAWPPLGRSSPASTFRIEVFPQPLGPEQADELAGCDVEGHVARGRDRVAAGRAPRHRQVAQRELGARRALGRAPASGCRSAISAVGTSPPSRSARPCRLGPRARPCRTSGAEGSRPTRARTIFSSSLRSSASRSSPAARSVVSLIAPMLRLEARPVVCRCPSRSRSRHAERPRRSRARVAASSRLVSSDAERTGPTAGVNQTRGSVLGAAALQGLVDTDAAGTVSVWRINASE